MCRPQFHRTMFTIGRRIARVGYSVFISSTTITSCAACAAVIMNAGTSADGIGGLTPDEGRPVFRVFAFDVETTGISVQHDAIIEMACCDVLALREFCTLTRPSPRVRLSSQVTELTGITQAHIDDPETPDFVAAFDRLRVRSRIWRQTSLCFALKSSTCNIARRRFITLCPVLLRAIACNCALAH